MTFNRKPFPPRRQQLRLPDYDYASPGSYFVTICTHGRVCLFGNVVNDSMQPNSFGRIVEICWNELPSHYAHLRLDAFTIMPNHVHGILMLAPGTGKRHALPEIVRGFKTFSARRVNTIRKAKSRPLWQRGYYEHVIRDGASLNGIRDYIGNNPAKWAIDRNNPDRRNTPNTVGVGFKPTPTNSLSYQNMLENACIF